MLVSGVQLSVGAEIEGAGESGVQLSVGER